MESDLLDKVSNSVEGLYLYKNVFSLVPRSAGRLGKSSTSKFFGNELNFISGGIWEFSGIAAVSVILGLNGWASNKLRGLKELDSLSCQEPRRDLLFSRF